MAMLVPKFNPRTDLTLYQGQHHQVVWFVDYADVANRRVRDVLLRSLDRFDGMDLGFAVRFLPQSEAGERAARAAIAASAQGRFADMHRALFSSRPDFLPQSLAALAAKLGLDSSRFESDMASEATTAKLLADRQSAKDSVPVPHTPMLFIDGVFYEGAWDDEAIIEAVQLPLGVRLEIASTAFVRWAAASGLVLIVATLAALLMVNFGGHDHYEHLRETIAGIAVGTWQLMMPLEIWVNDALMALFFLLVGIEIKRELVDGELSDTQRAALPLIAAIGGMAVPALIYAIVNTGSPTAHGWGIPMATDIAFTLGILTLLGDRIPTSLKVFISALAIADDLGAIVVIALFYGHGFQMDAFLAAVVVFGVMMAFNIGKIYARTPYIILGAILWYFVFKSGLHATLAGVLTAAAIPSRPSARIESVALQARKIFEYEIGRQSRSVTAGAVTQLQKIVDRLRDPGFHLQHRLESWSSFLILPLFAFFNTGIPIIGASFDLGQPEVLGTLLGLVLGKPIGICLFVYVAMKAKIGLLSSEITWRHFIGGATLCGIGFTMSIFIASSTFESSQLQSVKLAILIASMIAAVTGTMILLWKPKGESIGTPQSIRGK